jgi:hypothetical protein
LVAVVKGGGIYTLDLTAPVIHHQPSSQTVPAGTNITFDVGQFGVPPLVYQWQLNGVTLPDATNATLTLLNVDLSDSGVYSVRVSNGSGSILSSNALLTVLPVLLTTEPPNEISTNGAVLNGLITLGSNETVVWFQWGADINYGNVTHPVNGGAGFTQLSFNTSVIGLAPSTVYHYRVVASNILGTVVGMDVRFSTAHLPLLQTSAPITSWTSVASSADGSKLVAVTCCAGPIFVSTNSGTSWMPTSAPSNYWSSVASSADGTKLVAAASGPIYTSTDSGATWKPAGATGMVVTCSANGSNLVAAAYGGSIYTSQNSGAAWTQTSAPFAYWRSLASSGDGRRLAAAAGDSSPDFPAAIYTSENAGTTWTKTSAPNENWISVASSADGTKLVAGVNYGGIYTSADSGGAWQARMSGNWLALASSADGTKLVAINDYNIFTSTDSGATWANGMPNASWQAVASSADGAKLVAAVSGGGIYTSQSTPPPMLSIMPADSDLILSWIVPSTDFHLQENSRMRTTNWTDVEGTPILNFTNLHHQLRVPISAGNRFYRLEAR